MTTSGGDDGAAFRRALGRAASSLSRDLPWIGRGDPWAVLVSEVMLQQTQAARVVDPWRRFVGDYPTPTACADASLDDVLRHWSGLGYPRRARALHESARIIRDRHHGAVPSAPALLRELPGVGEYTANAVGSFAFGQRVAVLDTNVGRVLARAVANRGLRVPEARSLAGALLPARGAPRFNQAMLDLGARHCTSSPACAACPVSGACRWRREGGPDPAPRSAGVSRPQPRFAGSDRQLRGMVLSSLVESPHTEARLRARLGAFEDSRVERIVAGLVRDGLVERRGRSMCLATS